MNDETLLHRVITPMWYVQNGVVASQAFRPGPRDDKQMSVYDGDQIAAEASWRHYIRNPDMPAPIGVLSITVNECAEQSIPVLPDPETFPEHVLVDFREFGTNQIKRKSARLRDAAVERGWQYRTAS